MFEDKLYVISELGINHGGDLQLAKKMIDVSKEAGCSAVKIQKRTLDEVYSKEQLEKPRHSLLGRFNGHTTYNQKKQLEFEKPEYDELYEYCKEKDIDFFSSSWDIESQKFLRQYNKYNKVASPMLTNIELLETMAEEKKLCFISTGMSTEKQIDEAVRVFRAHNCPFILMHCTSTYPCPAEQVNLNYIPVLKEKYSDAKAIGFSNHFIGPLASVAAVIMGARVIECHITISRNMVGSDVSSSLEPDGMSRVVRDGNNILKMLGDGKKRVYEDEKPIIEKLRKQ